MITNSITMVITALATAVMWVSLGQTFLVKLPISYFMSIHASETLTGVALAGPISTFCGILVCLLYFCVLQKQMKHAHSEA